MSSITSLDLPHLFINNILSNHGFPSGIVSDTGFLFVSFFWPNLCHKLKLLIDLSTASHPETDGQKIRANQILEQSFWIYVSYHQDNSHTWLPLAIFITIALTTLQQNHHCFSLFMEESFIFTELTLVKKLMLEIFSTKVQEVQQDVKRELESAINGFKRYADKSRESPPGYMKVTTDAYHLMLSSQWKSIHPVFHISILEPVRTSTIQNWHHEPPPPTIVEEEEEWEVSQILDSKINRQRSWCLV
ncbi:hypothetical protein O181_119091, partial [Austropuccinia psidii MF-1]|nr:hypothetical protein [Austropuccinia psidii MF-1]